MFDGTGWWVIFQLVIVVLMVLMMSRMFPSGRRGAGGGRSGMGPMCMGDMGGHHTDGQTVDDPALEVLRRRYAAGELSDEQFDSMRRNLEERSP